MAMVDIHIEHWDKVFQKLEIGKSSEEATARKLQKTSKCRQQKRQDENMFVKIVLRVQIVLITLLFVLQASMGILYGYSDSTILWKFVTNVYFAGTIILTLMATMKDSQFLSSVACFLQFLVPFIVVSRTMFVFYVDFGVIEGKYIIGVLLLLRALEVIIPIYYGLASVFFLCFHLNRCYSILRRGRRVDQVQKY